ncbi:RHS repeat-associated core domain-containing protein [Brevundimonas sp.]|uniref:RHS repeat-associated core domain-containing protein n=1 Tax=Brevundimonas sp. TaxID=1871086 RepID=UPI001AC63070|nr:RHS repeat-associated core domain-containing protein [Brevundimonas sp.]MBN9466655.1 RHS repeat-associated core domain-containing protein [Brevundimonas sp.]
MTFASGGASITNAYDGLGRLTSQAQAGVGTMSYGYDQAGRRTSIHWPDGFWVAYDYNYANDLTAIRENGATNWQLASWAYDNLGRPIAQGRANGATTSWSYDAAGRLSALTQDLAGTANDVTLNLAYNPAGQIVTRTLSNAAYAYAPGAGNTAYANNGKNQVTGVNGNAVGYDTRQNITSVPGLGGYGYNGSNELTSATVGGTTTGLSYDPGGRLYQSGSTRFLYDGQQVVAEYDTSGGLLRRYVPGLGLDNVVTAYEGAGYDRRWLLSDERGSVVSITDGAANAIATNTYDEYGQPGAGNSGRFQYTGQMWLPEAHLYHYRARAYAPQIGRFMQTDPIGYQAGANIYAYVGADPVNFSDPLGGEQVQIGEITYQVCVDEPIFPNGEHGWWDKETVTVCQTFSRSRIPSFGTGGIGGGALRGGLYAGMPGAGFSGPPIQSDPQYEGFQAAYQKASADNWWLSVPVFAPLVAVPAAHYSSAWMLGWLGNQAALRTPFARNSLTHIFVSKSGHWATNTISRQQSLQLTVQNRYFVGRNAWGSSFYARNTASGQVWVRTDYGAIRSGGINVPGKSSWMVR